MSLQALREQLPLEPAPGVRERDRRDGEEVRQRFVSRGTSGCRRKACASHSRVSTRRSGSANPRTARERGRMADAGLPRESRDTRTRSAPPTRRLAKRRHASRLANLGRLKAHPSCCMLVAGPPRQAPASATSCSGSCSKVSARTTAEWLLLRLANPFRPYFQFGQPGGNTGATGVDPGLYTPRNRDPMSRDRLITAMNSWRCSRGIRRVRAPVRVERTEGAARTAVRGTWVFRDD